MFEQTLTPLGYARDLTAEPGLPARLVLRGSSGRQVDFHALVFDEVGNGWQQISASGRAWGCYPAEGLVAVGTVGGLRFPCLTPELQLRFHLGYEWSSRDDHDIALLAKRFGLAVPPPLEQARPS